MIVDVNVHLGRWPFGFLPHAGARLPEHLRQAGVGQAWACSLEALLHRDLDAVNHRTARRAAQAPGGLLVPIAAVNPTQPDWQTTLRRCVQRWNMPGVRLFPGYHGYRLDHPALGRLFSLAARWKLLVQVVVRMEDPRTQHPLVRVPDVNPAPLQGLLRAFPRVPVVLLGALRSVSLRRLGEMMGWGPLYVELSMLEGIAPLERLLQHVPLERVLFGSHAPLFVLESALLKLTESRLSPRQLAAIGSENAQKLLQKTRFAAT